eukprot:TRINITY_DN540_c0_g1_i3.p1 TRINITY_DN540_c0_g1~~TRINITY_DN540_c0_g1_i3.p1  ORF type:complete len:187 (+),score=55.38 TRINITY_DN540_c0_g1_i3:22-582(+)
MRPLLLCLACWCVFLGCFFFFFFKQKTAYEMQRGLVGSEMCIRDRYQRRVHGGKDNVFDSWELKIPSILKLDTYKYLFQTHSKKLKFRKQLKQEIAERIQRDYKLDKLPGFDVDPEKQIICGEIGNDAEENIGPNSIILINRDIDESEREYIPISIDESIKEFSFFEGKIQCAVQEICNQRKIIYF